MGKKSKLLIGFLVLCISLQSGFQIVFGEDETTKEPSSLYAQSAVLMDGGSGRVLFEKDGEEKRPMASTTKIMTCILALENGKLDDVVTVSAYAASQPDVQLQIVEGEEYYLRDLLYSLMLKSHNDTAVAIAEHIGQSVKGFANLMNQKAKELGAKNTYFITPNGLDECDENGEHSTTAVDLALIMAYAVKNPEFVKICQTQSYSFSEINHKRNCLVTNSNSFLNLMEGVIAGKTGYTSKAGYCYVCALENNGRVFIVTLLGCGWPNHREYKWSDTKKLMEYGIQNYKSASWDRNEIENGWEIPVEKGQPSTMGNLCEVSCGVEQQENRTVLIRDSEELKMEIEIPKKLQAPIKKGETIGNIIYKIEDSVFWTQKIHTLENIKKIDFRWCLKSIFFRFISFGFCIAD